ncbi:PREDICTED: CDK5 regulatory subunit-associated protein 2-like [Acropora digitifera]|uniref:CDK5 regulatory subunit-associated protein 2-like n=1 Tax=Acropora digitifera TaxID=70779 RepID=UPI00077A0CB0|nr:PREDICTED: CDK5 regulatory subunit-associated protein 2-like [Acropora digitifera]
MDSLAEDDVTLPLDFDRSTNIAKFKAAVAAGTGGDMLDSSAEFSEGRPLIAAGASLDSTGSPQMKTMKDYEYQISELKKENFGLKLRIYFLEQQNNTDIPEDVFKAVSKTSDVCFFSIIQFWFICGKNEEMISM